MLPESLQHQSCHPVMLFHCLCDDEDIIQVNTDHTLRYKVLEDVIHHCLEHGQAVGETTEHDQGFEEPTVGAEYSLPFITFLDPDIVVPPANIEFGKVMCAMEMADEVRNQWEWVKILDSLRIEGLVVLN